MRRWFAVILLLSVAILAGCSSRAAEMVETMVTVPVEVTVPVPVPVVETRVVVQTVEVERTVVVTATPEPTPAYVSLINVPADTLAFPITGDPISLDPQEAADEQSRLVVQQLYDGLFSLRGDGSTIPAAATGYTVSDDSKVYTVTLRADMTWSDGQPVIAQHYVDGLCRVLEPTVGNRYYYLFSDVAQIVGAKDFASGEVADCNTVGVHAVDDTTLVFTLVQPAGFFAKILASPVLLPVRTDLIPADPADWNDPKRFVGNGPYLLSEWTPNDHITLVKNPNYWDAENVAFDTILLRYVPDLADQLALYEAGELHVAGLAAEETARVLDDPSFSEELQVLVRPGTSYLGFNTQAGPTQDVNFRRAIASAIDRQALIEDVLEQPWHVPAQVVVPPTIPGYQGNDPTVGYGYDPDAARSYLAQAGYDEGNPPPPIDIWYNREGNNETVFRAIGQMIEEIGVPVRLVSSSWDVYLASLDACNKPNRADATLTPGECSYNLYRMGWVMDYADPASILDVVFNPRSAFQYTGWQSEAYETTLAKALVEQAEVARSVLYAQAERILLSDEVIVAPLQHYDRTVMVKDAIVFDFPPFGAPLFRYWGQNR